MSGFGQSCRSPDTKNPANAEFLIGDYRPLEDLPDKKKDDPEAACLERPKLLPYDQGEPLPVDAFESVSYTLIIGMGMLLFCSGMMIVTG